MIFLDSVESTHTYLRDRIKKIGYTHPLFVITQNQTNGLGSRDNSWDGDSGNLFFSFVIEKKLLPSDLPLQSASIYFSYLLKEILCDSGSKVCLKWPNDFYINEKKVGGTITNFSNGLYYCGIGLNLKSSQMNYGYLDISVDINSLLESYSSSILKNYTWKQIFSKYTIEFTNNKQYKTTIDNKKVSLRDAVLNDDGSITIENKKVFSLR